jgi:two-component system sensor histidine kinase AgrC
LRGYIEHEDMEGLRHYFHEEIVKVEQRTLFNNQVFSQLDRLKLIEIKGIIATKILFADEFGIHVNVEVPETIDDISIDKIHLSRVLGILIDNAIEASISMEEPCINLAFLTVSNKLVIVIENRLEGDIEFNKIFEEGYSTKGNARGRGLPTVRHLLSNYPSIIFNSRTEEQWMIHEIVIEGAN